MTNRTITISLICLTVLFSCIERNNEEVAVQLPEKLEGLDEGLTVLHSTDTVYATLNTKDPEKWGKYQLQFSTSVSTEFNDLQVVEFGAYVWKNGHWTMKTIYDRPFNQEEFAKWYNCPNGALKPNVTYTDNDNWLGKSDYLRGEAFRVLFYFIGKDLAGKKHMGYKEIVGVMKLRKS